MKVPPFTSYLGVEVERVEAGEVRAWLDVAPHHLNRRGVAHGGVIASLLDTALGAAVISAIPRPWWCATLSLSIQFVAGPRPGRLTATGRVLRRGSRVAFAGGEARDASGRLVAVAEGSWHLWPRRPGGEQPRAADPRLRMPATGERVRVGKILCVGRNYAEHVAEMDAPPGRPPVLFFKPPSALVPDGGTVRLPRGLGQVHHEVEMVVVIGERGRSILEADALDHVLGFAVGLDMTLRDLQSEAKKRGEPWALAKGFDTSAPVSPIVPRERVGDGTGLDISLTVNGEPRQRANTSRMLFGVAALVAQASRLVTLEHGDLLFTGTPSGVGPVAPGDVLEATLERVGSLRVSVEKE